MLPPVPSTQQGRALSQAASRPECAHRHHCRKIFREKLSGREGVKRPELEKAIDALGPGDVLVLAEWDRATRSMLDGMRIIERASLKALDRRRLPFLVGSQLCLGAEFRPPLSRCCATTVGARQDASCPLRERTGRPGCFAQGCGRAQPLHGACGRAELTRGCPSLSCRPFDHRRALERVGSSSLAQGGQVRHAPH